MRDIHAYIMYARYTTHILCMRNKFDSSANTNSNIAHAFMNHTVRYDDSYESYLTLFCVSCNAAYQLFISI